MSLLKHKVENWFQLQWNHFALEKENVAVHVEEFLSESDTNSKNSILELSIDVFEIVCELVNNIGIEGNYQIDLRIELIGESTEIRGVPTNKNALIDLIDVNTSPEILLFSPEKKYWIPKMEYYVCPLQFSFGQERDNIFCLYEEYRSMEDLKEGEPYTKWLTISYISHMDL